LEKEHPMALPEELKLPSNLQKCQEQTYHKGWKGNVSHFIEILNVIVEIGKAHL
jgi:hypothetical protein